MKTNISRNISHWNRKENNQENNPCCKDPNISTKDGNIVCFNCGTVIGKNMVGIEQRAFSLEELNKKKTTEKRWRDIGPRTFISKEYVDSRGNLLEAKDKILFKRLDKIHGSLIGSLERNKWEAKPKLKLLSSKLNIPTYIRETAWRIYCECAKKKLTMGRSIIGFVTASLYAAIRIHELPRLLEEVCDSELVPRKTVHQALGLLVKEILPILGLKYKPITSNQLVFKFGNDLKLPINIQKRAANLLNRASKKGLNSNGKDPRGIAASAIYMAAKSSDNSRTQGEIAHIAKITEVTLRSRAKDLKKYLN
ncbi:MAG: transcription initiation factor IIB family protein [Promethearchaeota archaeon]